ncbi:DUF305 domain-containing protein [Aureimonas jatrophae]|uniref:DUF305 domain-containing protein n=1 Tax=Aureimonas jatrophae TaxID=1166073 RepID=A0A1H0KL26_9HYPH|nr:DUF305 domain-containing protein [Aureimonas jatrophae]MBB3948762.1 uncharacterized protein (DUF305 family) [Aureimonas jatrophae]SDO56639.1 protein of unknown function [Aureimonas jatrophae]
MFDRSIPAAMLCAALLFVTPPARAQDHSGHAMPAEPGAAAAAHAGHAAMSPGSPSAAYMDAMRGMDEAMAAMPMTGQAGVDYARMMIPHHRSAVEMARAYLASGERDPVLVKLSQEIVASQEREIALLEGWLREHAPQ